MAYEPCNLNRRNLLKGMGVGGMGVVLGKGLAFAADDADKKAAQRQKKKPSREELRKIELHLQPVEPATVSVVKGNDRREIVYQSLKKIEDEVLASIGNKQVLIKPNLVDIDKPLCATHTDTIRAILDFLTPHCKNRIIVGESTMRTEGTFEGFKNYGYLELEKEYNVKLVDLNTRPFQYRYLVGSEHQPLSVRIISDFLDPNVYLISAACMKTHGLALVTLSLKNVLLGSAVNDYKKRGNDKWRFHATIKPSVDDILHYNMFHMAHEVYPDLAVIDGFVGMEGKGPIDGTPFDSKVAVASCDALAADMIGTKIMGFDPDKILYLSAMTREGLGQGDLSKITVVGTSLDQCQYHYKPDPTLGEVYGLV